MDVGLRRLQRQFADDRDDGGERVLAMGKFEAWVKRGQLDRNARRLPEAALRFPRDAVEGAAIRLGVALGVREGLGRFAQHVEAVAEPLPLLRLRALQRLVDRSAENEVAAE